MARLDGAWWKFQRAYDQTGTLSAELRTYLETTPFRLEYDSQSDPPWHIVRFVLTERPKALWAVQLGEIVHDLRSALDHAIWQLVLDNNGTPRDGVTGFPMFDDETAFLHGRNGRRPGIEARTAITAIQAYHAREIGELPGKMALAVLHNLWNTDKHRLLHLMTVGTYAQSLSIESEIPIAEMHVGSRILKEGTEVLRYRVGWLPQRRSGNVKVDVNVTCHVALDESAPEWVRNTDLMLEAHGLFSPHRLPLAAAAAARLRDAPERL